jgi:hypothetical protein
MTWHDFLPTVVCVEVKVDVGGEGSGFVISLIGIARDDGAPPLSVYIAMQNAIKKLRVDMRARNSRHFCLNSLAISAFPCCKSR